MRIGISILLDLVCLSARLFDFLFTFPKLLHLSTSRCPGARRFSQSHQAENSNTYWSRLRPTAVDCQNQHRLSWTLTLTSILPTPKMSTKQVPDSVAIRSPPKAKRSKLLLSLEMESSVTVEQRFRPNDLELLQTGQYSDAQVTAEGRVWKVHKGIVCQRSVFMRDFLSDQSTEQTPKPKNLLPGTTKAQAELLLEFIYSGSTSSSPHSRQPGISWN